MKYRLKHISDYTALRVLTSVISILPYRIALILAWILALIAFHIFRYRRKETLRRIQSVFTDSSKKRARGIAWISLRNLFFNAVEMIRSPKATRDWVETLIPGFSEKTEPISSHVKKTGRGAIIAVPHMGNWEFAGIACHQIGLPIFNIAARQRNPLANHYLTHLRKGPGIETIERGSGTLRNVLSRLHSGGILAILPDVRMRTADLQISFLGDHANIGRGMARFACKTGLPVFPCIIRRNGWSRLTVSVETPIFPDPDADKNNEAKRITQSVMDIINNAIRETPEQWFWYNRRWVLEPLD